MNKFYLVTECEYSDSYDHGVFDDYNMALSFALTLSSKSVDAVFLSFFNRNTTDGAVETQKFLNGERYE